METQHTSITDPVSAINAGIRVALVEGPLEGEVLAAFNAAQTTSGAIGSFAGIIRADKSSTGAVQAIIYTAYVPMAVSILEQMQREISQRHSLEDLLIFHSIGQVNAGQHSMLVAVASKHRRSAFLALEETVERIKAEAPVWKKELYSDGSHNWVGSGTP